MYDQIASSAAAASSFNLKRWITARISGSESSQMEGLKQPDKQLARMNHTPRPRKHPKDPTEMHFYIIIKKQSPNGTKTAYWNAPTE